MRPEPFSSSLLGCLAIALLAVAALAQRPPERVLALREGLVVHPTASEAYVMTPEGGIAAVDLGTGAVRWTSNAAAKPLAVVGNRLVSQVEPKTAAATNRLELVALELQERGAPGPENSLELPAGVRVSVGETLDGTFTASARPSDGSAIVEWSFVALPRGGMPPDPDEDGPQGGTTPRTLPETVSGAVRMDLSTGEMTRAETSGVAAAATQTWTIPASEIALVPELPHYESADGRHVLVSERVGDDRVWEKYHWTVFDRVTRRQVGEARVHVSFQPFVVRDSVLVYETTPFTRAGANEEPAKLRGLSLETGEELWSVPVRETVWRGPLPP